MWNNKAWLHTQYIYIITIQTINVGPTRVDLSIKGANIFPFNSSDQMLRANLIPYEAQWVRLPTICFLCQQDKCCPLDDKKSSIPLTLYNVTLFFSVLPCTWQPVGGICRQEERFNTLVPLLLCS